MGTGGSGNTVTALAAYNGALYVGGEFYTAGGVHAGKIAAWNGSDWLALADGSEVGIQGGYPLVNALSTFDDGTGLALALGGHFDQAGSVITDNLACWRCPDILFGDGFESGDTSAWSPLADEY
ncbi:MAG: hypothetical protein GY835_05255 [bacterium]|nr:hypothetical protein [bacterium]